MKVVRPRSDAVGERRVEIRSKERFAALAARRFPGPSEVDSLKATCTEGPLPRSRAVVVRSRRGAFLFRLGSPTKPPRRQNLLSRTLEPYFLFSGSLAKSWQKPANMGAGGEGGRRRESRPRALQRPIKGHRFEMYYKSTVRLRRSRPASSAGHSSERAQEGLGRPRSELRAPARGRSSWTCSRHRPRPASCSR